MKAFLAANAMKIMGWALVLMGLICLGLYIGKLRAERSLARCQSNVAAMNAAVERQNSAIEQMRRDGARIRAEQQAELERARRESAGAASQIDRLRRAAQRPQSVGSCETPPELREVENAL